MKSFQQLAISGLGRPVDPFYPVTPAVVSGAGGVIISRLF
jgi:hypothetical protein